MEEVKTIKVKIQLTIIIFFKSILYRVEFVKFELLQF